MSESPPSPPPPPDNYGAPPPPDYSQLPPPPPRDSDFAPVRRPSVNRTNGYAKASLYFGLLGWLVFAVGALGGPYYGFKALRQIKSTGERGRGMAVAGIILGFILFVWSLKNFWGFI
ncbi:MAG: hypothetical protein QOE94_3427 [Mycobacterium sp.]|nr:hypothetical protein [Mycobacterium sp.]